MAECPNLRWVVDKKGFLGNIGHYECSCTREKLNDKYVGNLCRTFPNKWDSNYENLKDIYKTCSKYKIYGLRN